MTIVSAPYKLTHQRFRRVATLFFFKRYWILYALVELVGIVILLISPQGIGIFIGVVFLVYPFTVPVRYAMVIAAKNREILEREMQYEIDDRSLLIRNDLGGTTTAQLINMRDWALIDNVLVLLYGRATIVMAPLDAVPTDQRDEVVRRIRTRGA